MLTDLPGTTSNTASPPDGSDQPETTVINFPKKNKMGAAFRGHQEAQTENKVYTGIVTCPVLENATMPEYLEEQRKVMVGDLCNVYVKELIFRLAYLGYDVRTEEFDKDMHFVQEALHSGLLRSFKVFHPIQDFIDESFELIPLEEFDPSGNDDSTDAT